MRVKLYKDVFPGTIAPGTSGTIVKIIYTEPDGYPEIEFGVEFDGHEGWFFCDPKHILLPDTSDTFTVWRS